MEDINAIICEYISRNWIEHESNRAFANEHDIDEKTVRQIKNAKHKTYSISLATLEKICASRDLTLEKFFSLIKR